MYRFFVALFIFSIKTSLVFANTEHSLIEVYCAGLLGENPPVASNLPVLNSEWGKLVENLETRNLSESHLKELNQKSDFRHCIEEHSKDLELGEFIVNGLNAIQKTAKEFNGKSDNSQSIVQNMFEDSREISTNDFSIVLKMESQALVNYESMKIDLELRKQHYQGLWQQFVAELKQKTLAKVAQSK